MNYFSLCKLITNGICSWYVVVQKCKTRLVRSRMKQRLLESESVEVKHYANCTNNALRTSKYTFTSTKSRTHSHWNERVLLTHIHENEWERRTLDELYNEDHSRMSSKYLCGPLPTLGNQKPCEVVNWVRNRTSEYVRHTFHYSLPRNSITKSDPSFSVLDISSKCKVWLFRAVDLSKDLQAEYHYVCPMFLLYGKTANSGCYTL